MNIFLCSAVSPVAFVACFKLVIVTRLVSDTKRSPILMWLISGTGFSRIIRRPLILGLEPNSRWTKVDFPAPVSPRGITTSFPIASLEFVAAFSTSACTRSISNGRTYCSWTHTNVSRWSSNSPSLASTALKTFSNSANTT